MRLGLATVLAPLAVACTPPVDLVPLGDSGVEGSGGGGSVGSGGQTSGGAGGGGAAAECVNPDRDCAPPAGPCWNVTCDRGLCVVAPVAGGTPTASQVDGDCKQVLCDGAGSASTAEADDPSDDGNECTTDACDAGVPSNVPNAEGTVCSVGKCNALAACVECVGTQDCPSGICQAFACVPATCGDTTKNGNETGVDCGGDCAGCPDGQPCNVPDDCDSIVCTAGTCQAPTCTDMTENGLESDVDCGGGTCSPCDTGRTCGVHADCVDIVCTGGVCQAPTCIDAKKNGGETDADCGGGACPGCFDGQSCVLNADCIGSLCKSGICCSPEAQAVTCAGKCGSVANNCNDVVDCGDPCLLPQSCGGAGVPNVCGCVACTSWSHVWGDADVQRFEGVAAGPSGNVVAVGWIQGTTDFGGGMLTSAGLGDVLVVARDEGGAHLWAKRFGDAAEQHAERVAVDAAGNAFVVGWFQGDLDFGGATAALTSAGGTDAFVAKLGPQGVAVWSKRLGSTETDTAYGVDVDAAGNAVVVGRFFGSADFGCGPLVATPGDVDAFVAKYDSAGNCTWSKRYGAGGTQQAFDVDVDGAGELVVSGIYQYGLDFGGGCGAMTSVANGYDAFVARLTPAGACVWSKSFGGSGLQEQARAEIDPAGEVVVGVRTVADPVDFGGGPKCAAGTATDIGVAKLAGASGAHVWSQCHGGASVQNLNDLAVDGVGRILLVGSFAGALDFGGGLLANSGGHDVFVAKLEPTGQHVWSKSFGNGFEQYAFGVGVDPTSHVLFAGASSGTIDFEAGPGGGPMNDAFLIKIAP